MSPLTLYLARFFGLACLLMCVLLALRAKSALQAIDEMISNRGLMLLTGIVTLIAGAACVVGHNVWSGGPLPIAVTLLGWLTLIKGAAIVAVPPAVLRKTYKALHYPQNFRVVMAFAAALSAWLAVAAFEA
ncbi:hypothetical protein [Phenylobacterium montanum]|uniref:Uncharacterized protein n=1 Tax=Phenylobacterium montanum TaxID=2823693 RepID=A0A975FYG9_9CAUL|nr:hypothetical protein [Caulobacter sp. S6]QUD87610.1 hypothetical protein KCG34_21580 [Caulobacter sp. S6]